MNLIAETMSASNVQQDIYSQLARGLLLVNYKDNQQAMAQAMDTADQIMRRHADVPFAFVASGLIKERAGNTEQAIEDYGVAIALNPYYSTAYSYRAAVYESQKQWSLAIDDYSAIIQINSDAGTPDPFYYLYRGLDYLQLQDYANALNDFDKAISYKLNTADVYYWRGSAYFQLGDNVRFVDDWNTYLQLGGQLSPDAQTQLAQMQAYLTATPTLTPTPP
jgi:tetratricopeptide (TPR) repeat protein